jgi:hypothetical protein
VTNHLGSYNNKLNKNNGGAMSIYDKMMTYKRLNHFFPLKTYRFYGFLSPMSSITLPNELLISIFTILFHESR